MNPNKNYNILLIICYRIYRPRLIVGSAARRIHHEACS